MHSPFSVKGFFKTRLFLFRPIRFLFLPVFDSETQLYAYREMSQEAIVHF